MWPPCCADYGVRTQLYTEERKFKQKMAYASKLAIPYAVIIGEDELAEWRGLAQGHEHRRADALHAQRTRRWPCATG